MFHIRCLFLDFFIFQTDFLDLGSGFGLRQLSLTLVLSKDLGLSLCFSFLFIKKFLSLSEFCVIFLSFFVYPFINFLMLRSYILLLLLLIRHLLSFFLKFFVEFCVGFFVLAFNRWIPGSKFRFWGFRIWCLLCLWGLMRLVILDRDEVFHVLLYWFTIFSSIIGFPFILYFYLANLLIISS